MTNLIQDWKKKVRRQQESLYNSLGDRTWDEIDKMYLSQKVGYGFFGCSKNLVSGQLVYSEKETKAIDEICNKILALNSGNTVKIAFIYVFFTLKNKNEEGIEVLCKIYDEKTSNNLFIDLQYRVYKGWDDYLNNNRLPQCYMCYPNHGRYSYGDGIVNITFRKSHACDVSSSLLKGLDITSSVATLTATGVTVASLALPITTPFIMGAFGTIITSGAYDIGRSAYKLYDIKNHHGSIGFRNAESRNVWMNLAGTACSVASIGSTAVAKAVTMSAERSLGQSTLTLLRALNMSAIVISGIGAVNDLISVVLKFLNGTLNRQDVLQFIQVCFFFLNAIVTERIANQIISDIASSDVENVFCLAKNTIHNCTKSIIIFKDMSNYQLLKNLLIRIQVKFLPNIDLDRFETITLQIIECVHDLTSSNVNWVKSIEQISEILYRIWISYKHLIIDAMDEVKEALNIDWKSSFQLNNTNCYTSTHAETMTPDAAQQIRILSNRTVLHCTGNESKENENSITKLGYDFNNLVPGANENEYLHKFRYICQYLMLQYNQVKENYENQLDMVSSNENFNHEEFDRAYGILSSRRDFFVKESFETVDTQYKLEQVLNDYYIDLTNNTLPPPEDVLSLQCPVSTLYTFCRSLDKGQFTDEEYYTKAKSLTNINVNPGNSQFMRKNNVVFVLPVSNNQPYKAMLFYTDVLNGNLVGQLLVLKNIDKK